MAHLLPRALKLAVLTLSLSMLGWSQQTAAANRKQTASRAKGTIEYKNSEYGFTFKLPASWKGYKILWSEWRGTVIGSNGSVDHTLRGPKLVIRNPKWTQEDPWEDMPILIYTIAQWNEGPVVSAAPIDSWELGRNKKYVFAVPPRWDYDFAKGYEEAEKILTAASLHTFAPKN